MTEKELRARVCAQADRWVGKKESNGTHREIIDIYNRIVPLPRGYRMSYSDPWCAAAVSGLCLRTETVDLPGMRLQSHDRAVPQGGPLDGK